MVCHETDLLQKNNLATLCCNSVLLRLTSYSFYNTTFVLIISVFNPQKRAFEATSCVLLGFIWTATGFIYKWPHLSNKYNLRCGCLVRTLVHQIGVFSQHQTNQTKTENCFRVWFKWVQQVWCENNLRAEPVQTPRQRLEALKCMAWHHKVAASVQHNQKWQNRGL